MIAANKEEKSIHVRFLLSQLWVGQTNIALNYRPVGKQKQGIEATSHLFLHFNPLVNTKAISSIS